MSEAGRGPSSGHSTDLGSMLGHAMARHRAGDLAAAEAGYRAVLARAPDEPDASHLLGLVLFQRRMGREAYEHVRRAVALRPDVAKFHHSLGKILAGYGKQPQALRCFVRALRLAPGNPGAECDLASALCDMKRYAEAAAVLEIALARSPDNADLRTCEARLLLMTGQPERAVTALHAALRRAPSHVGALNNLGVALNLLGNAAEAAAAFERALALDPAHVDAHVNYGQLLLMRGDFAAGWAHHEWRLRRPGYRRRSGMPLWRGEPLNGRTVLVWCEQGLGDAIQFIRYVPLVAARGGQVLVECRPPLRRLIAGVAGVTAVTEVGEATGYDLQVPLMSLPCVFGTTLSDIPSAVPYVPRPAASRLDGRGARLKVGLVWAGNPDNLRDAARSRSLAEFAPLAALGDVAFFGLQVGAGADDAPPPGLALTNLMPRVKDFYDTAADIAALDLLISVDSSSGHLAGAIGAPVWLLLDRVADWRWLADREDTPWYPTMRLFRRESDWPSLFARVADALRAFEPRRR